MCYVLQDFTTSFITNLFANPMKANIEIPLIYRVGWKKNILAFMIQKKQTS